MLHVLNFVNHFPMDDGPVWQVLEYLNLLLEQTLDLFGFQEAQLLYLDSLKTKQEDQRLSNNAYNNEIYQDCVKSDVNEPCLHYSE